MNLLTDALPTAVMVGDAEVAIQSDFRGCLRTILAFEDPQLTTIEKRGVLLSNLYGEMPEDPAEAFLVGVRFLNGGKAQGEDELGPRLYSFEQDAGMVFSAFRQTHGIDLQEVSLHWWVFLALFMDLGADTTFCNLVGLRKRVKDGTATKEERKTAADMGAVFELVEPDTRTAEERAQEAEFMRLVRGG